jgi:ABC-type molybdate transport system substrate-binding protein
MQAERRRVLLAAPMLAAAAFAAANALAATTDLVVSCDTTLARPLRAVADQFRTRAGVTAHIFPTPPGLILPQLEREVQNDIVVTRFERLSRATEAGIIAPGAARSGGWRNRLVLAARHDARPASLNAVSVAVCDPTPASDFDGAAVLSTAGLWPKTIVGVIDTDEVLYLLASGVVPVGLLHATDLSADARLEVMAKVPDEAYGPIVYAAAVTRLASRPNPDAFVRFLADDEAMAVLRAHGLESWS